MNTVMTYVRKIMQAVSAAKSKATKRVCLCVGERGDEIGGCIRSYPSIRDDVALLQPRVTRFSDI